MKEECVREYAKDYDDPYKLLAYKVIASYGPQIAKRMLKDHKLIRRCVVKEAKELDVMGFFLDCVVSSMHEEKRRMAYIDKLGSLGRWFYVELDKPRFRQEIRNAFEELGLSDLLEEK